MSDNRGGGRDRGGRGGRGSRGDRDGRGGGRGDSFVVTDRSRGGFQGASGRGGGGDRGGYRGGYTGEPDRGGRGGFRGGHPGESDRGGRGGSRGGYRGDSERGGHGARGGFRGGRGGSGLDVYKGPDSTIPPPDPKVTELEDRFIQKQQNAPKTDVFPYRPNFGTNGNEILLWANYFRLNVKVPTSLFRYDLKVTSKKVNRAQEDANKEQAVSGQKQEGQKKDDIKEPTGKKLSRIIRTALDHHREVIWASEFKAHVVCLGKFKLPADGIVEINLAEPNRRTEKWFVRFDGPQSINISALMHYLETLSDPGDENAFPKFPAEIDALGVVLGHIARSDEDRISTIGRSRFFAFDMARAEADSEMPRDSLLAILRGYVQSVRPATGRLLLNTNVTHGVFRSPSSEPEGLDSLFVRHGVKDLDRFNDLSDHAQRSLLDKLNKFHKFLARSRIICAIPTEKSSTQDWPKIERTIGGLATTKDGNEAEPRPVFSWSSKLPFGSPTTVRFHLREPKSGGEPPYGLQYGTHVQVSHYFEAKYNVRAKPGLPLINVGTRAKPTYVLAELCTLIPGQPIRAKLSPSEQNAMIKFACRAPPDNALSLTTRARTVLALDDPFLGRFGISVEKNLITVTARELAPPSVSYSNLKGNSTISISPDSGAWLMKQVKVVKPGRLIETWAYLCLDRERDEKFVGALKARIRRFQDFIRGLLGINITAASPSGVVDSVPRTEEDLKGSFKKLEEMQPRPEFVLVVLPEKSTTIYNMVKKFGDVVFGYPTVCVVKQKLFQEKGDLGYFANVGLKVNLKFGGVNHKLTDELDLIKKGQTMLVGYDVTHPTNLAAGAGANAPSLVGLVASVDRDLAQWPAVAWQNPQRQEMVNEELKEHFKTRLKLWQDKDQKRLPPKNIIIFRDGVSEGQFQTVLDKELPFIRAACREIYPANSQPRISLIVSVKRHQTRFYPTDPGHIHHESKSPREGTIVDRGVTNVRYWDFFLQAHASLQGTARPAHYTVLLDEIFRADYGAEAANELEKLTHGLCYLYGRATKAVSICPPAYYADLVCTRARIHYNELFEQDDTSSISSGAQDTIRRRKVHDNLKDTMYYI
ncbi:hypothetical protein VTK56DRAFT_7327 [Thermocarpiscus australiensis]